MAEVTIIRQPDIAAFSGNPMLFTFCITPFGQAQLNSSVRLQVKVQIERSFGSGNYREIYSQIIYPNSDGFINFDVSSYVDAWLSYFIPLLTMGDITECSEQSKRYRVDFTLQDNTGILVATQSSDVKFAIKGGFAYDFKYVQKWVTDSSLLLTTAYADNGTDLYRPGEFRFVYMLVRQAGLVVDIAHIVKLTGNGFNSGESGQWDYSDITLNQWRVYCIPLTPHLFFTSSLGFDIKNFVLDTSVVNVDGVTLVKDYRPYYNTKMIMYRSSLGSLETITLCGTIDTELENTRVLATRAVWPEWYENGVLKSQQISNQALEQITFKANTGFISKNKLNSLRDLFLSGNIYEVRNGELFPVVINKNQTKLFSNHDRLFDLEIEFQNAYESNYFTPEASFAAPSCPSVDYFRAFQSALNTLEIQWSLQVPYDTLEVEIINGSEDDSYYYNGPIGRVFQTFTPPTGTDPVDITVRARTVCNFFSTPKETSAWTTLTVTVYPKRPPVAVDDTASIAAGYTSPVTLTVKALDNDYDPDGDAIDIVPASGSTNAGGTYSISAAGVVTYQPPSSGYAGLDYFDYTLEKVSDPTSTDTGRYFISVGSYVGTVYVRLDDSGIVSSGSGSYTIESGPLYLRFYSDAAGTIPIDVGGLGLVINIRKYNTTITAGHGTTATTDYTVSPASGTSYLLFNGTILNTFVARDGLRGYTIVFEVQPGTGYTPI